MVEQEHGREPKLSEDSQVVAEVHSDVDRDAQWTDGPEAKPPMKVRRCDAGSLDASRGLALPTSSAYETAATNNTAASQRAPMGTS